jgi:hypothetical protein
LNWIELCGGNFLKEVFPTPLSRTFKSCLEIFFFRFLEIPKNLLQKVLWWGMGQSPISPRPNPSAPKNTEKFTDMPKNI